MVMFCGLVSQSAVLASFYRSRTRQGDVFHRMSQSTTTSIANGHFLVDFDNGNLTDQFQGVAAVLAVGVLIKRNKEMQVRVYQAVSRRF